MPRAEVGTPKWLANKMRAKGLQRLRWYCQMCEKQCRDENGFKCHRMSESHQRQMQVFMQRSGSYMDEFSREFEGTFMQLMRTRYCRTKVLANTVYQDVIADKQHIHMNATRWTTLSEFVLHLERTGKCKLEHTERGFLIEYIDTDKIRREKEAAARRKAELSAEQRRERELEKQVQLAWESKQKERGEDDSQPGEEKVDTNRPKEGPVVFQLPQKLAAPSAGGISVGRRGQEEREKRSAPLSPTGQAPFDDDVDVESYVMNEDHAPSISLFPAKRKRLTALEALRLEQERKKARDALRKKVPPKPPPPSVPEPEGSQKESDELWLQAGMSVKVIAPRLANGIYNERVGTVKEVIDEYIGIVEMVDSKDVLRLDQDMLRIANL